MSTLVTRIRSALTFLVHNFYFLTSIQYLYWGWGSDEVMRQFEILRISKHFLLNNFFDIRMCQPFSLWVLSTGLLKYSISSNSIMWYSLTKKNLFLHLHSHSCIYIIMGFLFTWMSKLVLSWQDYNAYFFTVYLEHCKKYETPSSSWTQK